MIGETLNIDTRDLEEELKIFDFSHFPLPKRNDDTLRVFYNNINGLEINEAIDTVIKRSKIKQKYDIITDIETHTKAEAFLKQIYTWEVNICALAEPCIEWRDSLPRKVIMDMGKHIDKYGHWTVATSKCSVGSFLKPGGALVYNDGDLSGRIIESGTDPWGYGRWAFKRYKGKHDKELLVVSGYRVGKRSGTPGPSTAWHQQKVLLQEDNREEDPDEAFITDLLQWMGTVQRDITEVIIMLDANEKWTHNAKIKRMAEKLQLHELNKAGDYQFPASHPCITNPSRSTTIDFWLCTEGVLQSITYATRAPYDLGSLGDHRGLIVDINMTRLWGTDAISSNPMEGRKLTMNDPNAMKKYQELLDEYFTKQRIVHRTTQLYEQLCKKKKTKWYIKKKI